MNFNSFSSSRSLLDILSLASIPILIFIIISSIYQTNQNQIEVDNRNQDQRVYELTIDLEHSLHLLVNLPSFNATGSTFENFQPNNSTYFISNKISTIIQSLETRSLDEKQMALIKAIKNHLTELNSSFSNTLDQNSQPKINPINKPLFLTTQSQPIVQLTTDLRMASKPTTTYASISSTIENNTFFFLLCIAAAILCATNFYRQYRLNKQELYIDHIHQKKLSQDSEFSDLYLSAASHEIQTPLFHISGLIELIEMENLSENQQSYLHDAKSACNHLEHTISMMSDYSKSETGTLMIDNNLSNINALLDEIRNFFIAPNKVDIEFNVDDDVGDIILGDPKRITRIIINLIKHAIENTKKGHIFVDVALVNIKSAHDKIIESHATLNAEEKNIQFSVTDTGEGLHQDQALHLFDEQHYSGQEKISKLNLPVSQKLAKAMGGELTVESNLNFGSTFFFTIPTKRKPMADRLKKSSLNIQKKSSMGMPIAVLVVEDDRTSRHIIQSMLAFLGYPADIATSGLEAVQLAKGKNYDIIFMDIQMPSITGIEAAEKILAFNPSNPPVIIATTANTLPEQVKQYRSVGMDSILAKPLSLDSVKHALKTVIQHPTSNGFTNTTSNTSPKAPYTETRALSE